MENTAIYLQKTLCAMRWIMMMNGNHAVVKALEQNIEFFGEHK